MSTALDAMILIWYARQSNPSQASSALFKQAQQRLLDLQRREAAELSQSLRQAQATFPGDRLLFRVEDGKRR